MAEDFQYDVFLSHSVKDKAVVRPLVERLRKDGLKVWFDEWIIQAGDQIYLAIERGLEESQSLLLCLSPNALGSEWVTMERSTVLFRYPANVGRLIPLLLADCKLQRSLWSRKHGLALSRSSRLDREIHERPHQGHPHRKQRFAKPGPETVSGGCLPVARAAKIEQRIVL